MFEVDPIAVAGVANDVSIKYAGALPVVDAMAMTYVIHSFAFGVGVHVCFICYFQICDLFYFHEICRATGTRATPNKIHKFMAPHIWHTFVFQIVRFFFGVRKESPHPPHVGVTNFVGCINGMVTL